mmetsp:Transcript_66351/g.110875  ORF Transcript_66351/g.110875 Transcript_66351/m.110875 type:complete len:97 (-) Transcript_66351:2017-2307(-)
MHDAYNCTTVWTYTQRPRACFLCTVLDSWPTQGSAKAHVATKMNECWNETAAGSPHAEPAYCVCTGIQSHTFAMLGHKYEVPEILQNPFFCHKSHN